MKYIGYGVLTMLASIYLGSWLLNDVIPDHHWIGFPVFVTLLFIFIAGMAMFAGGLDIDGESDD
jgi:ABC-type polysaccharide/polyol phosphate export permease